VRRTYRTPHRFVYLRDVQKISVLIADAQRLVADALARSLRQFPDIDALVELPLSGTEAIEVAIRKKPDVMLLDYWITGMSGPAVARAILEQSPNQNILLMSWFLGPYPAQELIDCGARGILLKGLSVDEVAEGIRRVHAGESFVYAQELDDLLDKIRIRQHDHDEQRKKLLLLKPREIQLLQLLSDGKSLKEVAGVLGISPKSMHVYIHRILQKTGARNQLQAVAMARNHALIR
jgi:DNA-binding NarL/FixJ family response regulator